MPKNIVICCDGTGNEIKENLSNVLKLYRCLKRDEEQLVFYDPGIGTLSSSDAWARFKQRAKVIFGLATGWGLDQNIREPYDFLVEHWEDGDRIFLFGFSRGAYTVRALAGMIYLVGLLEPSQKNLSGHALVAYKRASSENSLSYGWRVRRILNSRRVPIHFVGAWDTVSSVIVPRADRMYIPSLQRLPYTRTNQGVRSFRHAMAIDERRRMFRLNKWIPPELCNPNPFDTQDLGHSTKQVWFAGSHSDVGGGWPEPRSGLSKFPLRWMIDEAVAEGLKVSTRMVNHLIPKDPPKDPDDYVPAKADAPLNDSMIGFWPVLEYLPKRAKYREWPWRRIFAGVYLPRSEPRPIATDAEIHASVTDRKALVPDYRPENLERRVDRDPPPPPPDDANPKPDPEPPETA
ncbi:DUF2235 domain-containing protein [Alloyangia pacifica]|uniref:Uncharacterized protein, PA2063/DUF2235 family n=1 Tax=Alloyangia pacifica TaxID=311180 RepID=A0A1I6QSI6_9RHOB|nr:DUF2235 domain-containing protein [Alloyangia pacifica]SDF97348.1 Uncharacterized protein, PA2063/DUF2235 family [Alloyangia pacifica]SFS55383.1 Uncharacterized protein, PA2063/DUF2235 family [Alloyangia pacifica]